MLHAKASGSLPSSLQAQNRSGEEAEELELSRSFLRSVAEAEGVVQVAGASELVLESSVGALRMSDLDDLLARLQAGQASLATSR